MRSLWFYLLLQSAFYADASFGTPFFTSPNSTLCHPWNCVSNHLGLPSTLPPREQFSATLKSLLPPGPWQDVVDTVVDTCYNDRPRSYVSTCPGQAVLHCAVDILIQNCPEDSRRKDDGCYPVSSLSGTKYMFTQSRYQNLEMSIPHELRPAWFLRNYFSSKCCDLPDFINSTVVSECGFSKFIHYYDHEPKIGDLLQNTIYVKQSPIRHTFESTTEKINNSNDVHTEKSAAEEGENLNIIPLPNDKDPLSCCDMDDFIQPEWLEECSFHLSWDREKRLSIDEVLAPTSTVPPTTTAPVNKDVRLVPLSCEEETCVFAQLDVIPNNSFSDAVDREAFIKILDNFTAVHPEWEKAKARVLTQCVERAKQENPWGCQINILLACTLDVLSENCPYTNKQSDPCRHSRRNNTVCQVSSSMYRPKNRRTVCGLPNLINNAEVLAQCGVTSISRTEFVPDLPVPKKETGGNMDYGCEADTASSLCLLNKMGLLNKYGFLEHFKILERLHDFPKRHPEWTILVDAYVFLFDNLPMYRKNCNSTRDLLNVLDVMLMTCPASKRKNTTQCKNLLNDMITAPINGIIPKDKLDQIVQQFNDSLVYWFTKTPKPSTELPQTTTAYTKTNPQFNFGVLNSGNVPPVTTVNVKKSKEIPVILPVYMRTRNSISMDTSSLSNYKDGVFKSEPFLLHEKIPVTETLKSSPVILP